MTAERQLPHHNMRFWCSFGEADCFPTGRTVVTLLIEAVELVVPGYL